MRQSRSILMLLALLCIGSIAAFAQEKKTVTGTVLDSAGHALKDVSVIVKKSAKGTSTDAEGHFKIQVSTGDVLLVSAIGYDKNEIVVGSQSDITVSLKSKSTGMEEAVVTAMGIKRQSRALGYAVSTVSSKELTESGSTNFASALYGKAAGVKINSAPGGASSAVSVQVRGVSSIGLNTQPLYVVDGVPIRLYNDLAGNLGSGANNNGYWSNSRIQGNGVLDINPEDIESLTVLKGASASALYGSEATNGVVVITTKRGVKGKGLGIDVNYIYDQEKLAYSPDYQNTYGPGYDAQTNVANGIATWDGWATADSYHHPYWNAYTEFGPKFDGSQVRYWDGTMIPYVAQKNNYKDFYSTGYNSTGNVAVSNSSEKGNYRFSYNRNDYKSIVPGSNLNKNNFNFNGTLKLSDRVNVDVVSSYNNNFTHNRPQLMSQIFGSYAGFFNRADKMSTFFNKYQTTDGYKYIPHSASVNYDTDQQFPYNFRATNLMDYLWTALKDSYDETQNRFINSVTLNVAIAKDWKFRSRVGGDMTSLFIEDKEHNTEPVSAGNSGKYATTSSTYNVFYGDGLLSYTPKITNDLSLGFSAGATARKQVNRILASTTNTGLQEENFFNLANSAGTATTSSTLYKQLDVAGFGVVDVNYKSWLYLEGTGRYEGTSTLPPGVNNYFYPSVNSGFVFSDVLKMPSWVDYGKLRASYGIVGNHPNIYQSNVGYYLTNLPYNNTNIIYQDVASSNFGNLGIKSEKKREFEFGLETRMVHDRIGLDVSYYNNKVSRQILTLSTSTDVGAGSALQNAGDLSNYGIEAAINATPVITKNFKWTTRFNFAINRNKLVSLPAGTDHLDLSSQDGGYLIIRGIPGQALGNIYVHPKATDAKGNAIIDDNGWYTNTNDYKYAGNIMPKIIGGFSNSVSYKNFALDFTIDYRFGGKLVSIPTYYQIGAGMFKSTLKYRDAAHGGISYDAISDANNDYVANANGARHDGMILKGVTSTGATNTKVIPAAEYYENTYDWETNGLYENAVFNNSYIKLREVTLSYTFPKAITSKLACQNLQFSFIARNLLYIYKTLPNGLDPEMAVGSSWLSQGIDGGSTAPTRSLGVSLRARF